MRYSTIVGQRLRRLCCQNYRASPLKGYFFTTRLIGVASCFNPPFYDCSNSVIFIFSFFPPPEETVSHVLEGHGASLITPDFRPNLIPSAPGRHNNIPLIGLAFSELSPGFNKSSSEGPSYCINRLVASLGVVTRVTWLSETEWKALFTSGCLFSSLSLLSVFWLAFPQISIPIDVLSMTSYRLDESQASLEMVLVF